MGLCHENAVGNLLRLLIQLVLLDGVLIDAVLQYVEILLLGVVEQGRVLELDWEAVFDLNVALTA